MSEILEIKHRMINNRLPELKHYFKVHKSDMTSRAVYEAVEREINRLEKEKSNLVE